MENKYSGFDLPCTDPERMDDWFIEERPRVEEDKREELWKTATHSVEGGDKRGAERQYEILVNTYVANQKVRRRHAIDSCFFDCPMRARLLCLDDGLQPGNQEWGINGGYAPDVRRSIVSSLEKRDDTLNTRKAAKAIVFAEKKAALDQPE